MNYRFGIIPSLCIGCRTCELACSFTHARDRKPGRSRIYPIKYQSDKFVPVVCLQCDEAACVKSCLFDALRRNEATGAIDLDRERCVHCRACVAACPFGCVLVDAGHEEVVKCDICGGTPMCVQFCPTRALVYEKIG